MLNHLFTSFCTGFQANYTLATLTSKFQQMSQLCNKILNTLHYQLISELNMEGNKQISTKSYTKLNSYNEIDHHPQSYQQYV